MIKLFECSNLILILSSANLNEETPSNFQLVSREKVRKMYDENDLVNLANQIQQVLSFYH